MYNTNYPDRADLPTSARLIRSTVIAAASALVLLVAIVLPSEYGIDPIGVGGLTGLRQMGEIKVQLAAEAAAQNVPTASVVPEDAPNSLSSAPSVDQLEQRLAALESQLAAMQLEARPAAGPAPLELPDIASLADADPRSAPDPVAASPWRDEVSFVLTPGEGAEYKLVMAQGAVADFEFSAEGGVVNFDQHGEGQGQSFSYEEGRGIQSDSGTFQAPVEGTHGWFFRNRGTADVTVTLRTGGDYAELKRLI